jgi:hypothetical protein
MTERPFTSRPDPVVPERRPPPVPTRPDPGIHERNAPLLPRPLRWRRKQRPGDVPSTIDRQTLIAFAAQLGLDANRVRHMDISYDTVTVEMYEVDADGAIVVVDREAVMYSLTIPIV